MTSPTRIELVGTEIEVVASEISRDQHDRWDMNGFPSDEDSGSEEYDSFVDMLFTNHDCGFLPDEHLQLFVNGELVEDLHSKINSHGNWEISPTQLLEVPAHYLCALTYSKGASLYFEVPGTFDFKKLRWTVRDYRIGDERVCYLLDLSFDGRCCDSHGGNRFRSQSVWLERFGV